MTRSRWRWILTIRPPGPMPPFVGQFFASPKGRDSLRLLPRPATFARSPCNQRGTRCVDRTVTPLPDTSSAGSQNAGSGAFPPVPRSRRWRRSVLCRRFGNQRGAPARPTECSRWLPASQQHFCRTPSHRQSTPVTRDGVGPVLVDGPSCSQRGAALVGHVNGLTPGCPHQLVQLQPFPWPRRVYR